MTLVRGAAPVRRPRPRATARAPVGRNRVGGRARPHRHGVHDGLVACPRLGDGPGRLRQHDARSVVGALSCPDPAAGQSDRRDARNTWSKRDGGAGAGPECVRRTSPGRSRTQPRTRASATNSSFPVPEPRHGCREFEACPADRVDRDAPGGGGQHLVQLDRPAHVAHVEGFELRHGRPRPCQCQEQVCGDEHLRACRQRRDPYRDVHGRAEAGAVVLHRGPGAPRRAPRAYPVRRGMRRRARSSTPGRCHGRRTMRVADRGQEPSRAPESTDGERAEAIGPVQRRPGRRARPPAR